MDNLFLLLWTTLLTLLLIASFTDWRRGIIPNWLVVTGTVLGIVEHVAFQGLRGMVIALVGGTVWLAIGWLFWSTRKIGGGDVKLFAMIAAFTGVTGPPDILMGALLVQMIAYMIEFARGHMNLRKPFAPAIGAGSLGLMIWQFISIRGGI